MALKSLCSYIYDSLSENTIVLESKKIKENESKWGIVT